MVLQVLDAEALLVVDEEYVRHGGLRGGVPLVPAFHDEVGAKGCAAIVAIATHGADSGLYRPRQSTTHYVVLDAARCWLAVDRTCSASFGA